MRVRRFLPPRGEPSRGVHREEVEAGREEEGEGGGVREEIEMLRPEREEGIGQWGVERKG